MPIVWGEFHQNHRVSECGLSETRHRNRWVSSITQTTLWQTVVLVKLSKKWWRVFILPHDWLLLSQSRKQFSGSLLLQPCQNFYCPQLSVLNWLFVHLDYILYFKVRPQTQHQHDFKPNKTQSFNLAYMVFKKVMLMRGWYCHKAILNDYYHYVSAIIMRVVLYCIIAMKHFRNAGYQFKMRNNRFTGQNIKTDILSSISYILSSKSDFLHLKFLTLRLISWTSYKFEMQNIRFAGRNIKIYFLFSNSDIFYQQI